MVRDGDPPRSSERGGGLGHAGWMATVDAPVARKYWNERNQLKAPIARAPTSSPPSSKKSSGSHPAEPCAQKLWPAQKKTFRTGRVKNTKVLPTGYVKGFLDCLAFPTFRTVREKGFLDSPMFPTGRVTCFLGAPTFRTGINEIVVAFGPKELFRCQLLPRCTSRLSARRNGC